MTKGIHHITAIASDARKTVHFYTKVLGLRLVKKTVNQDDPETYHLFFGDRLGEPGMDLTFFIFLPSQPGRRGSGLVTKISFVVPRSALGFWQQRFVTHRVNYQPVFKQFGFDRLVFFDFDDQQLELVGVDDQLLKDDDLLWTTKDVSRAVAIRCFYGATLTVDRLEDIAPVLTNVLGYQTLAQDGTVHLFQTSGSKRADRLEVQELPSPKSGLNAAGTVHHIAFRAKDEQEQLMLRKRVWDIGLYPTEVINRFYFKSVYFRTSARILFEIATDGPGFTADEDEDKLGMHLSLPPFLEDERSWIEKNLVPLDYVV